MLMITASAVIGSFSELKRILQPDHIESTFFTKTDFALPFLLALSTSICSSLQLALSQRLYRNRNPIDELKLKSWVSMGLQSVFKLITFVVFMPLFSEMSCSICTGAVLSDPTHNLKVLEAGGLHLQLLVGGLALAYMLEELCAFITLEYEDATIVQAVSAPAPYLAWVFFLIMGNTVYQKLKMYALMVLVTGVSVFILGERLRQYFSWAKA